MPFVSPEQQRFMWAKHPDIARRWTAKYGSRPVGKLEAKRIRLAEKMRRSRGA